MNAFRTLLSDLIEKRLLPVVLLLIAALVAVPLLLAKSPAAEPEAPSTPSAAVAPTVPPTPAEPAVRVVAGGSGKAPLRGKVKDPFQQQHVPSKSSAADGGGTPPVTAGQPAGTGTSGDGGTAAPPRSEPTYAYASVDVRFGQAGKRLRTIRDVPRLTPLPNASRPIVVFLGMRRDRTTAVFLVSTDVRVQGLGQCVPSQKTCEAIELREGDVALLDYTRKNGNVEQYELDLTAVMLHQTSSQAVAQRAYARVSRVGRLIVSGSVRTSVDGTARRYRPPFRYSRRSGVLHIAPWASKRARKARAHAAVSDARLADLRPSAR